MLHLFLLETSRNFLPESPAEGALRISFTLYRGTFIGGVNQKEQEGNCECFNFLRLITFLDIAQKDTQCRLSVSSSIPRRRVSARLLRNYCFPKRRSRGNSPLSISIALEPRGTSPRPFPQAELQSAEEI